MPGEGGYFSDFGGFGKGIALNLVDLQQYKFRFPFFDLDVEIIQNPPPYTKPEQLKKIDFFQILLNGQKTLVGASKAEAKANRINKGKFRGTDKEDREIGKFLGDFAQVLVASTRNRDLQGTRGYHARAFGSGDGMACVMCYFISKYSEVMFNGYKFGFELLILNGLLTIAGLLIISKKYVVKN